MSFFDKEYQLDKEAVTSGIWRTLKSGAKVKVASLRNPAYLMEITRIKREMANDFNTNDDEIVKAITCKAMSKAILFDWVIPGEDIPYTPEEGEKALLRYDLFREEVSAIAATDTNYKPELIAKK